MGDEPVKLTGEARRAGPGAPAVAAEVVLAEDGFTIGLGGGAPIGAAYRDIATLAVDRGRVLLVLGVGAGAMTLFLERFGQDLGTLVTELRDRRARQRLTDRFVDVPHEAVPMVEYAVGDEHGVAQLAYHAWGAVLMPLDERRPWSDVRRGEIDSVQLQPEVGSIEIVTRSTVGDQPDPSIRLLALGAAARRHRDRFVELRDAAATDASALVGGLMPDAPFGARQVAGSRLIDGRPSTPESLGGAWSWVESAVLGEPTFAASYAGLRQRAGSDAPIWISLSPESPGSATPRAWFFVTLPGNLVAMELVTEGAHATYCFRAVPRATYGGQGVAAMAAPAATAVTEISHALIDSRFLREPMALPDDQLRAPRYLRYRMALEAIPSLAAARRRFVARLVHSDEAAWRAALDDLIGWHTTARDDAAPWPGRAAQEAQVSAAADGAGEADVATDAADPSMPTTSEPPVPAGPAG